MVTGADNAIHFPEEELSSDQLEHSSLFLLFSQDATSYAMTKPDGELISIGRSPGNQDHSEKVFQSVVNNKLFSKSVKASLALTGKHFVLAPSKLVDENNAQSIFELDTGISADQVGIFPVGQRPIVVLQEVQSEITSAFLKSFPFGKIFNARALLLDSLIEQWEPVARTGLFVNVSETYIDLYQFKKGQLQLANCFDIKTDTDVLYFILNVFEQCGIVSKKEVWLSGQVEKDGELVKLCKEHLDRTELHPGFDDYKLGDDLAAIPRQSFVELINLCTCAS